MHTGISTSLQAAMLVGAAQIAIAAPLHAQERQVDFDIPAQELSKSLREFAATTDMDLLYPPQLVENRQARRQGRNDPHGSVAGNASRFRSGF